MCRPTTDARLMSKIINGGRTNLHEWVKQILKYYYEEQVVEGDTSINKTNAQLYANFHEGFVCIIPPILHNFLVDKGIG